MVDVAARVDVKVMVETGEGLRLGEGVALTYGVVVDTGLAVITGNVAVAAGGATRHPTIAKRPINKTNMIQLNLSEIPRRINFANIFTPNGR